MTSRFKISLLATVSAAAIGVMAATPASAFDQVNWTWNTTLTENIAKNVNVNINLTPTGMVMVEDLQVQIGDVKAISSVHDVSNNQPLPEDTFSGGPLDIQWHYGIGGTLLNDGFNSPEITAANVDETDQSPDINGTVTATLDLSQLAVASFDALTELPSVVSAATAVANNTSISSDVSVQLHEGQFAFDTRHYGGPESIDDLSGLDVALGDNSNLSAAGVLGILALTGNLGHSDIEAGSYVGDILNATVDSSATAVANNLTVNVAPVSGQDSLAIADIVQFAYADVEAKSIVHDVNLNNYTNLGVLSRPIVNSVATAVGNNKSITVMTPAVVVTP